jgi:hypothetical protein
VNTGFAHFIFLFEEDGIVSTSASNSKEGTASKLSPLEMSPFKRRRSTVLTKLSPFDLTPADGGRNVDALVVAISRHPPRSVSDHVEHASRSSLSEHQREAPDHRDVEEGRSRHEDSLRQHEATQGNRHEATSADPAVRLQSPPHRSAPRMGR